MNRRRRPEAAAESAQRRSGRPAETGTRPTALPVAQAQAQPQAAHALHHAAVDGAGKEVPRETVPVHRRARRVLRLALPHRNAGKTKTNEST